MLIKEIIEFELRGAGPLGRTCTPITGYFYGGANVFQENL